MAITAHLEDLSTGAENPRDARRALRLEALGATADDDSARVTLHNISRSGLLLETEAELAEGESIEVDLPLAGVTSATIIWASGRLFGCQFDSPVSEAVLSAAQLRSVSGEPDIALSGDEAAVREGSFGVRLKRLRKDRGLTLAQIASAMSVSKPTVWAWEQGKAHPIESRMGLLAQVLGVSEEELRGGADDNALRDFLARSRERIAQAVGTTPDKIRIMIEL
ncbi:helix-turn-helix domain-containing protein [Novosphingobium sp. ZN18A2]|uniref:helix-turn-helix domain-containing protein n=1 Tax=Novosphingobium sp. ZN18A2 TaxID=3079861 RepID=UPI0030D21D4B